MKNESKKKLISIFAILSLSLFLIPFTLSDNPPQSDNSYIHSRGPNWDLEKSDKGFTRTSYFGNVNVKDSDGKYKPFNEVIKHSKNVDTLTLNAVNSDITLQFIALTPAGNQMPIQSVVGFDLRVDEYLGKKKWSYDLRVDEYLGKKKWSYDLNLPNTQFSALVNVTTELPLTIVDNDVISDELIISFKDVLDYGYTYNVVKINDYNAVFTINKDWNSHGIKNGDFITIDPTVTYNFSDQTNIFAHEFVEDGGCNNINSIPEAEWSPDKCDTGSPSDITSEASLDSSDNSDSHIDVSNGENAWQRFYVNVQEDTSDIIMINWTFEGVSSSSPSPYAMLFTRNWSATNWTSMADNIDGLGDQLHYPNISSNIDDYINDSGATALLFYGGASGSNEDLYTDFIKLEITYDDIIINTPISNEEVLNTRNDTINTSSSGYNDTIWYSLNDGKKNTTICTLSGECELDFYYPKQGYFNLTVWGNKSDGTLKNKTVNNIFVGNQTRVNVTKDTGFRLVNENLGASVNFIFNNLECSILTWANFSSINKDSTITSLELSYYKYNNAVGEIDYVNVYKINHFWEEGTGGRAYNDPDTNTAAINGTTANERWYGDNANDGNTPFDSTDADWQATGLGSGTDYNSTSVYNSGFSSCGFDVECWQTFQINGSDIQEWITNESSNNGLRLIGVDGNANNYYYSDDYAVDVSLRPYFNITYYTPNTPPSSVTLNSPPDLSSQNFNKSVFFNFTGTDDDGDNMTYTLFFDTNADPISIMNITSLNQGELTVNLSNATGWADGTYYWKVYADDLVNNENVSSAIYSFQISTVSPSISLNYPSNNQWFTSGTNIYFNYTSTDGDDLDTCELWGNWTTGWHKNYTWVSPASGVMNFSTLNISGDSNYIWNIWCNDTANNDGWGINATIGLDTLNPNVIINSITTTTNSQSITFSHSESDTLSGVGSCWYSIYNASSGNIDGTNENVSIGCNSVSSPATVTIYGTFNLTLYSNDTAGNVNSTTDEFTTSQSSSDPPGGGGGGETEIIVIGNVTWSMETEQKGKIYELEMVALAVRKKSILFSNEGAEEVNLNLTCEGVLCEFLTLDTYNITLPVGLDIQTAVGVTVKIPKEAEDKTYTANVIATDDLGNEQLITIKSRVGGLGLISSLINKLLSFKSFGTKVFPYAIIFIFMWAVIAVASYAVFLNKLNAGKAIAGIVGFAFGTFMLVFI